VTACRLMVLDGITPASDNTRAGQTEGAAVIDFRCAKCGELLSVPSSLVGEMEYCPSCLHLNRVPQVPGTAGFVPPMPREGAVVEFGKSSSPRYREAVQMATARPICDTWGEGKTLRHRAVFDSLLDALDLWRFVARWKSSRLYVDGAEVSDIELKRRLWEYEPATERQREFADNLGLMYPADITKAQMSGLLDQAPASVGQKAWADKLGVAYPANATRGQMSQLIDEHIDLFGYPDEDEDHAYSQQTGQGKTGCLLVALMLAAVTVALVQWAS